MTKYSADCLTSGIAVGLAGTFRLLGGSIATTMYTSIINNGFADALPSKLKNEISGLGSPASNIPKLITAATKNTAVAYKAVPGISAPVTAAARLAVKKAYVSAFRTTYLAAIGFGVAAIIAAFFTKDIDRGMKNEVKIESKEVDV